MVKHFKVGRYYLRSDAVHVQVLFKFAQRICALYKLKSEQKPERKLHLNANNRYL